MKTKRTPLIVGLTGRMGAGKSTVARYMARHWQIPVYYADDRAKKLMNENEALKAAIREYFGPGAYRDGRLDKAYLAERVFADPAQLARLEALVHPYVHRDFWQWYAQQNSAPYVLVENAILGKSGMLPFCDAVVVVDAPEKILIDRIKRRNGWSETHIRQRLSQQPPYSFEDVKTFYINNSKDFKDLPDVLKDIHQSLLNLV